MTKQEAVRSWVREFNAIPQSVVSRLMEFSGYDDMCEVTPLCIGDTGYVWDEKHRGDSVEIIQREPDKHFFVRNQDGEEYIVDGSHIECTTERSILPMWGTMWAFGDSIDNDWLEGEFGNDGLALMADCGFRIYQSDDYGYVFGIDGAGYDFFEAHWEPLYDARGMRWHKED